MAAFIALPSPNARRRRDTASIAGSGPPGHTPIPQSTHAFLNVPYDPPYEPLYLAFIGGLAAYGLVPRATLEIPGAQRRLDRIADLIASSAEPPLASLRKIHEVVRRAARVLKRDYGTLYAARPFKEVVLAAMQTAEALR
jgi:hypothetical protein